MASAYIQIRAIIITYNTSTLRRSRILNRFYTPSLLRLHPPSYTPLQDLFTLGSPILHTTSTITH
ncbi:MAG: hypothetical protein L0922_04400, partial [Candidatus Mariimomonas ferrooxydans]